MEIGKLKLEHLLFFAALCLAGFVRLLNLGSAPLNDSEARLALDAWQFAQGLKGIGEFHPAPYPGTILLTGLLFSLLEPTNFLARLLPALAGVFLLLVPIQLRDLLGKPAAIILAFGLAVDPGLVVASRLASGPMLAVTFGLLAVIFWQQGRPRLAGFLAAMFLLAGPQAILGLLIGAVAFLLLRVITPGVKVWLHEIAISPSDQGARKQAFGVLVLTLALAGTAFLQIPQGLAAMADAFLAYFRGWTTSPTIPAGRVAAALVIYQPVALIFALVNIGRTLARRRVDTLDLLLIFWTGIALLHALLYPARQTLDLVWVLVPTWMLAARELDRLLEPGERHLAAYGQALLIVLLAGLLWFNLAGISRTDPQVNNNLTRLLLMAGVVLLAAISTILVSLGWSWSSGKFGLLLGIAAAGSLYLISTLWSSTQVHANTPAELWYPRQAGDQAELLAKTARDLSVWNTGFPDQVDIVINSDSPSIQWVLRNFKHLTIVETLPTEENPSILITQQADQPPALTAAYRGQDFSWYVQPGWANALPENVAGWITFRQAPLNQEPIILWARSDLFPGGEPGINSSVQP